MACFIPLSPPSPTLPLSLSSLFRSTCRADGALLFYRLLFAVTPEAASTPACVFADCLLTAWLAGQKHSSRYVWISRQQDGKWIDDRLTARNRWLSGWLEPPCLLHWHIWASGSHTVGVWDQDGRLVQKKPAGVTGSCHCGLDYSSRLQTPQIPFNFYHLYHTTKSFYLKTRLNGSIKLSHNDSAFFKLPAEWWG